MVHRISTSMPAEVFTRGDVDAFLGEANPAALPLLGPLVAMPRHLRLRQASRRQTGLPPPPVGADPCAPAGPFPLLGLPSDLVQMIVREAPFDLSQANVALRGAAVRHAGVDELMHESEALQRSSVLQEQQLPNLVALRGMPWIMGARAGSGALGLYGEHDAARRLLLDRLQSAADAFFGNVTIVHDGMPCDLPTVYRQLAAHAWFPDDFNALLGRAPDSQGRGGIGILALPVDEQIAPLAALQRSARARRRDFARGRSFLNASIVSRLTEMLWEAPRGDCAVSRVTVFAVNLFPRLAAERAMAIEAHLAAWESLTPANAAAIGADEAKEWAQDLLAAAPLRMAEACERRVEAILDRVGP